MSSGTPINASRLLFAFEMGSHVFSDALDLLLVILHKYMHLNQETVQ